MNSSLYNANIFQSTSINVSSIDFKNNMKRNPKKLVLNTGWDIIVPDDFPSIQDAINHSNPYDRILVRTGIYKENIQINQQKEGITLHGEDIQNTIIDGISNTLGQRIDQQHTINYGIYDFHEGGWPYIEIFAQSFKPTIESLSRVDLLLTKIGSPGGVTVSIREDLNGKDLISIYKSENEISYSYSIDSNDGSFGWVEFDFKNINVNIGQTYYIVMKPDINDYNNTILWGLEFNNYCDGCGWSYWNYGIPPYDGWSNWNNFIDWCF